MHLKMGIVASWFRFVLFGILVVLSVCLLSLILTLSNNNSLQTASAAPMGGILSGDLDSSPNAVTRTMVSTVNGVDRLSSSLQSAIPAPPDFSRMGRVTVDGSKAAVNGVQGGVFASARFVGSGARATASLPVHVFKAVTHISIHISILGVLHPASSAVLPTISVPAAALASAGVAPSITTAVVQATVPHTQPIWPIHGAITTLFGVPEPPYQPIHTGIDISDGRRSGTTPIVAFEPGRVVEVVHEKRHLGNHVTIDHGHGLTSVYGHLSTTTVSVGQAVNQSTILGYEGHTGVATGTHLHFEIRQNGIPMNPMHYVPGHP